MLTISESVETLVALRCEAEAFYCLRHHVFPERDLGQSVSAATGALCKAMACALGSNRVFFGIGHRRYGHHGRSVGDAPLTGVLARRRQQICRMITVDLVAVHQAAPGLVQSHACVERVVAGRDALAASRGMHCMPGYRTWVPDQVAGEICCSHMLRLLAVSSADENAEPARRVPSRDAGNRMPHWLQPSLKHGS